MKRFADLSREEIENKRRLLTPTTTQKATTSAATVFRDYLAEKGKPVSFEQYEKKELDAALSSFYIEARTKTGEIYKKTSLDAVRYGINRHLKSSPQNKDFDILTDPSFASSNEMFKVVVRRSKHREKLTSTTTILCPTLTATSCTTVSTSVRQHQTGCTIRYSLT
ncbi:hypothetical protein V1264_015189 [Littorina saxatilis]|uniref:Uncharacterized protein n=1 Tax=Littorina saxatilis TaxID=31220 RepID=A0AAN9GFN9_9CAEN